MNFEPTFGLKFARKSMPYSARTTSEQNLSKMFLITLSTLRNRDVDVYPVIRTVFLLLPMASYIMYRRFKICLSVRSKSFDCDVLTGFKLHVFSRGNSPLVT